MNIMNAHDFVDTTRNIDFVNEKLYGKQSISKVQLVALAIMAQKINGEYVKRGGKSDFVDIYDPELDETFQRFAKVKEANRNVMEILAENNSLITMDVMIEAHDMIKGLEMDFMFNGVKITHSLVHQLRCLSTFTKAFTYTQLLMPA